MSEALSALWASIVRTLVPVIVGAVSGWAVGVNLPLDPHFEVLFGTALSTLFTGVYYVGVRLLETYVTPKFGWLLLFPKAPVVYSRTADTTVPGAVPAAKAAIKAVTASDTPHTKEANTPSSVG